MNFVLMAVLCMITNCVQNLYALDQTNRYMGHRLFEMPERNKKEWGSTLFFTSGWAEAKHAYSDRGVKIPLFDDLGAMRLKEMVGEGPVGPGADPVGKTEREKLAYVLNNILGFSTSEASVSTSGQYRQIDLVMQAVQNIGSGLFVHVALPFKAQKIRNIVSMPQLCEEQFTSKTDFSASERYEHLRKLIIEETTVTEPSHNAWTVSLPRVLKDAGITSTCENFDKAGLGDLQVFLGWGGEQKFDHAITKYVEGSMRFGLLAPVGKRALLDQPYSLPFGSEHHWAIVGRGEGELGFKYCALGASLGSTIFFQKRYEMRLPINAAEQGWLYLNKISVRVDRGSMWEANGYIKGFYDPYGLSLWMGLSYYAQGTTSFADPLKIQDCDSSNPSLFSKEVLLSDPRTQRWHHYMLHWGFSFDARKICTKKVAPLLIITYDHSLAGQQVWKTNIFGGSLGVYCEWKW